MQMYSQRGQQCILYSCICKEVQWCIQSQMSVKQRWHLPSTVATPPLLPVLNPPTVHRTPIAWSVSQWPLPRYNVLVLHGIAWHLILLYGIAWHLMLLYSIAWHLMLLYGTTWHLILRGIRCYCMVLPFPYHSGDPSQLPESPVRSAWVRQSAILFIRISHLDHLCGMANTKIHKYKYTDIIHRDFTQCCLGCS